MITRYYEILLDVFIGLAFAVGFKVIGGYAMKMMHGWFKDEPAFQEGSVPPATVDKSRKKRAISFLSLGLAAVWLLSGLIQIRPVLVTTRASAIVTVLLGAPFAQHPNTLAQTLARIWSTHAITGNILSIVCQVSLFLLIALGGSHWLGRLSVWLSALLSLALFVLLFGASGFIAGLSDLILGSNGTPFWLFVLCVLLMLPAHVWSSPKALHAVQVGRTAMWILLALATGLTISRVSHLFMSPISLSATAVYSVFTVLFALVSVLEWVPRVRVLKVILSVLTLLAVWWLGEDFGLSGDFALAIGSAPVVAIIALGASGLVQAVPWKLHLVRERAVQS